MKIGQKQWPWQRYAFFDKNGGRDVINYVNEPKIKRTQLDIWEIIFGKFHWNWPSSFGVLAPTDTHTHTHTCARAHAHAHTHTPTPLQTNTHTPTCGFINGAFSASTTLMTAASLLIWGPGCRNRKSTSHSKLPPEMEIVVVVKVKVEVEVETNWMIW